MKQIIAGVELLVPGAAPVRPVSTLRRGRSHVSWVLSSGVGRLVAKVCLGERHPVAVDRLVEHRRVWDHGVPVPPLLAFTTSSNAVAGRLLIVSEYLSGQDADEASRSASTAAMVDAMRATGSAVAQLHQVPVEVFGDPVTGLGTGPATWSEAVAGRIEVLRRAFSRVKVAPDAVVSSGLALLGGLADAVSPVVQPAVTHLDLYLPNVLLDDEHRFRVLLDLEHVRWVDPVMDFVKPAMWMFTGRPAWAEAFAEGYRAVGGWPDRWAERLALVMGLELLTGIEYWTRVADDRMRKDYLRWLRAWMRSDGADPVWPSSVM